MVKKMKVWPTALQTVNFRMAASTAGFSAQNRQPGSSSPRAHVKSAAVRTDRCTDFCLAGMK